VQDVLVGCMLGKVRTAVTFSFLLLTFPWALSFIFQERIIIRGGGRMGNSMLIGIGWWSHSVVVSEQDILAFQYNAQEGAEVKMILHCQWRI
jgi:hypothetical protein